MTNLKTEHVAIYIYKMMDLLIYLANQKTELNTPCILHITPFVNDSRSSHTVIY